jgi:hypothetical protein
MTKDMDAKGPAGKTERLIPLLREHHGPGMALDADANGHYFGGTGRARVSARSR